MEVKRQENQRRRPLGSKQIINKNAIVDGWHNDPKIHQHNIDNKNKEHQAHILKTTRYHKNHTSSTRLKAVRRGDNQQLIKVTNKECDTVSQTSNKRKIPKDRRVP